MNPFHLLIIPSFYSTLEDPIHGIFFKEQAKMLRQAGLHVGILYPEIRPLKDMNFPLLRRNYFQCDDGIEDGLPTFRLHGWNLSPGYVKGTMKLWTAAALRLFKKYVSEYGYPRLIHAQSSLWAGTAAREISHKYDLPYFITEHRDNFLREEILPGIGPQSSLGIKIGEAFNSSDQIIAVSRSLKTGVARYSSRPKNPPAVIPNFIDTDFFNPPSKKKSGAFTFLAIAHLYKNKNFHVLLEAFRHLLKQEKEIFLKIGGDGPEKIPLERQASELGISSHVQFLGKLNRDQVKNAFAESSAFILPSQHETFGIVLIEALSMGLPVIGTYSGGPQEIINERVGKLIPPNDPVELMEGMRSMMKNFHLYSPENLREYATNNFGKKTIVSRWLEMYSKFN